MTAPADRPGRGNSHRPAMTAMAAAVTRTVHFLGVGVARSTHLPHIHAQKLKTIP